jgi:hypothetical protein
MIRGILLLMLLGCNSTIAPGIKGVMGAPVGQTEWEPVELQVPECDRPATLLDVAVELANVVYQNDRMWAQDTCCWVYRGRPAFRSYIMYGEHSMFAHRVLRPEEWDGEDKYYEFRSIVIAINAIIQEWNDPAFEHCWRVYPVDDGRYTERIYIGALQAAPLDYRWTIELRHSPLSGTQAPQQLINTIHDMLKSEEF